MTIGLLLALVALGCLVAAAVCDVRSFEIPDTLSIVLLATAVGYGIATPGFDWLMHGLAVVAMFGFGLLAFSRGWLGGGDVKLMVALAGWTGIPGLIIQLALVSIAGGVLTVALILARRGLAASGRSPERLPQVFHGDAPLPYAVPILVGSVAWAVMSWPI